MADVGSVERRLAVVVFTDHVGSTSKRQRMGESAFAQQWALLDELQFSLVEEFDGEVVKHLGDGVMAGFASVTSATRFGTVLQDELVRLNARLDDPLVMRVGIAVGEVERRDGDYFGFAPVEGARLCAACNAGEVLASDLMLRLGGDEVAALVVGERRLQLKGITGEYLAWQLQRPVHDHAAPVPVALRGDDRFRFVGRDAELHVLEALWAEATRGEMRAALISGEAGVGKTRLVAELAARARDSGGTVLFGHNDEDVAVPYQPFAEALRAYVDRDGEPGAARLLGKRRGELSRLVPTLDGFVGPLPAPLSSDPDTERLWLFEAVVSWLATASSHRPLLLVLDDLHWAARPTVQLLRHLLTSSPAMPLMVVMTSRDPAGAPPPAGPLAIGVNGIEPRHLPLTSFDLATLVEFLERAAGHELDDDGHALARLLHSETGGNALFVREMLLHLRAQGSITQHDGRWLVSVPDVVAGEHPDGVRRAVSDRVARLGPAARQLMEWSAVIGRQVDHELLVLVSGADDETTMEALE